MLDLIQIEPKQSEIHLLETTAASDSRLSSLGFPALIWGKHDGLISLGMSFLVHETCNLLNILKYPKQQALVSVYNSF